MTRYSARLIVFAEQDRVGGCWWGNHDQLGRGTLPLYLKAYYSVSFTFSRFIAFGRPPSSTTGPSSVFDDISAIAYPLHHGPSSSVVGATPIADFAIHAIFSPPIHFSPQSPSTMLLIHSTPILPHSIPCSHRLSKLAPSLPDLSSPASPRSKSSSHRPL